MVGGRRRKRITAMKNNVPKTKEKTNAEYAIPVAAQEEWNPMHGLKTVRPTSILVVKYQGAEVGRYLCLYRDVGYAGQDRTEIYPERSCTVTTYLCRKLTPSTTIYNRCVKFGVQERLLTFHWKFWILWMFCEGDDTDWQCGRDNAYWPISLCVCRSNAWKP